MLLTLLKIKIYTFIDKKTKSNQQHRFITKIFNQ